MAFCILNVKTVSSFGGMKSIQHERIRGKEYANVDSTRSHLNRALTKEQDITQLYNQAMKHDYYSKPDKWGKTHKEPHVKAVNFVLTYSPEAHIEQDPQKLNTWIRDNLDFIRDNFKGCPFVATLHMDEATPHIHVSLIPTTESGKISKNKHIPSKSALVSLQDRYAAKMAKYELVRGIHKERNSPELKEAVHDYEEIRRRTEHLQERYDTIKERGDIKFNEMLDKIKPLREEADQLEAYCIKLHQYATKLREAIDQTLGAYKALKAVFGDRVPEAERLLDEISKPLDVPPLDRDEGVDR